MTIGKFNYSTNQSFDPFVNEQVDGTYLVSDTMYHLLKDTDQFKLVDFSQLTSITPDKITSKITSSK